LLKCILAAYYKEFCDSGFNVTLDLQDEVHMVIAVVKWLMEMMGYSVTAQYDFPVFSIRLDWAKHQRRA